MLGKFITVEEGEKITKYDLINTNTYRWKDIILTFKDDKPNKVKVGNLVYFIRLDGVCLRLKEFYEVDGNHIIVHDLKESGVKLVEGKKEEDLLMKDDKTYISSEFVFKIKDERIIEIVEGLTEYYLDSDGYCQDLEKYFIFDPVNKIIKVSKPINDQITLIEDGKEIILTKYNFHFVKDIYSNNGIELHFQNGILRSISVGGVNHEINLYGYCSSLNKYYKYDSTKKTINVTKEETKSIKTRKITNSDNKYVINNNRIFSVKKDNVIYSLKEINGKFWSKELRKRYSLVNDEVIEEDYFGPDSEYSDNKIWFNLVDGKISKGNLGYFSMTYKIDNLTYYFDVENNKILKAMNITKNMIPVDEDGICKELGMKFILENYELKCLKLEDNPKKEEYTKLSDNETFTWKGDKRYISTDNKVIRKEYYLNGKLMNIKFY